MWMRRKKPSNAQRAAGMVKAAARMIATATAMRAVAVAGVTIMGLASASAAVSSVRNRQGDEGADSGEQ